MAKPVWGATRHTHHRVLITHPHPLRLRIADSRTGLSCFVFHCCGARTCMYATCRRVNRWLCCSSWRFVSPPVAHLGARSATRTASLARCNRARVRAWTSAHRVWGARPSCRVGGGQTGMCANSKCPCGTRRLCHRKDVFTDNNPTPTIRPDALSSVSGAQRPASVVPPRHMYASTRRGGDEPAAEGLES